MRLVLNATDVIVRFEDRISHKLYEATFFDRDFSEYSSVGGLEFVTKLMISALKQTDNNNASLTYTIVKGDLNVVVCYSPPLFPKPVVISITLPSVRRASGGEDMETLTRRIKELESRLVGVTGLQKRIEELEDMTDGVVIMPGLLPISKSVTTFCLLPVDAIQPQGIQFAVPTLGSVHAGSAQIAPTCRSNSPQFETATGDIYCQFIKQTISLKQVKYLTNCTTLIIAHSTAKDIYSIGSMASIGSLNKLCTLILINISNLTDISWIESLTHLSTVVFHGCSALVDITPMQKLPNLKSLDIRLTGVKNTVSLTNPGLTIIK